MNKHKLAQQLVTGMLGGKPLTWQQQLLAQFSGGEGDVGVTYRLAGTIPTYWIYHQTYQNYYVSHKFGDSNAWGAGADASKAQNVKKTLCALYKGFNSGTTPAVTFSGSWTAFDSYSYFGAKYRYSGTTAGAYAEVAIPNATTVGAVITAVWSLAGIMLVTIDGDNTLANLCSTAQDLVDAGVVANTCLVANGGTLNPTDRVIDAYNLPAIGYYPYGASNNDRQEIFTTSLAKGTHTVRLTVTGYKNSASSAVRVGLMCFFGGSTSTRTSDAGVDYLSKVQEISAPTDWISYSFKPTGATSTAWLGHSGQTVLIADPILTVNGTPTTLTSWTTARGSSIVYAMQTYVRHPETGANNQGTFDCNFIFNKSGLTIDHTVTWLVSGTSAGYPGMMTAEHATFDRYKTHLQTEKDLTANDNSAQLNTVTEMAWAWDVDGNIAELMYIPNLAITVENWIHTTTQQLYWMDVNGTWKKAYPWKYQDQTSFAINDVWTSSINYRTAWFPDGANAALAGKY